MSADLTRLIAAHKMIANHCWCDRDTRLSQHEHSEHLASVIESSDWLAAHDREVAAGAVEAAAEAMAGGQHTCFRPQGCVECGRQKERDGRERWLRDRAQAIREGRA